MKIFFIVFGFIFLMAETDIKAQTPQCPEGYWGYSVDVGYPDNENPQCHFHLEFCYVCAGIGPNPITIARNIKCWPLDGGCEGVIPSDEWISKMIIHILNEPCTFNPCYQGGATQTRMIFPACRKWVNTAWEDGGEWYHFLTWEYCGEAECEAEVWYCMDYSTNPFPAVLMRLNLATWALQASAPTVQAVAVPPIFEREIYLRS